MEHTLFEKKSLSDLVFLIGYIQELQSKWMMWSLVSIDADWRKNFFLCLFWIRKALGVPKCESIWILILYIMVCASWLCFMLSHCLKHAFSLNFPLPVSVNATQSWEHNSKRIKNIVNHAIKTSPSKAKQFKYIFVLLSIVHFYLIS